ncbi:MAG: outer membrane lipoprotein chaperone LolA [Gammaproteobacteria bacterium]|nr:outer membrane lipoprotein chaperone LolA [Gammaproteobacteria bacterium]
MHNIVKTVIASFSLFIASTSLAFGADALQSFFAGLKSYQADFMQKVSNSQLGSVNQAKGKLFIQRPGKFRWDYVQPYQQQIVSDGKKIWIYDHDLEQVTVKRVTRSLSQTPAMLLSADYDIDQSFDVTSFMGDDDLSWFELIPKGGDTSFTSIRMGFKSDKLVRMTLEDNLGQTTELSFTNSLRNLPLPKTLFNFTPPKGVDVFESDD